MMSKGIEAIEAMVSSKELMEIIKDMQLRDAESCSFSFSTVMDDGKKLYVEIEIKAIDAQRAQQL